MDSCCGNSRNTPVTDLFTQYVELVQKQGIKDFEQAGLNISCYSSENRWKRVEQSSEVSSDSTLRLA